MDTINKNADSYRAGETPWGHELRRKNAIAYYKDKISSLESNKMTGRLLLLLTRDVLIAPGDLSRERPRKKYIKKCISYYRGKIRGLQKPGQGWWSGFWNKLPLVLA